MFWEGTDEGDRWHGHGRRLDHGKKEYLVEYDDGDRDWYDFKKIKYTILPPKGQAGGDGAGADTSEQPRRRATKNRVTFASLGMHGVMLLGHRVEIFWSNPDAADTWYSGTIVEFRVSDSCHFVQFDDGDSDWQLDEIKYRVLTSEVDKVKAQQAGAEELDRRCQGRQCAPAKPSSLHHTVHSHHGARAHWNLRPIRRQEETPRHAAGSGFVGGKSVGCAVEIFWEDDDQGGSGSQWYRGTIDEYAPTKETGAALCHIRRRGRGLAT